MDLKDCLTFPKYEKFPPTYVLRYHGINPVVSRGSPFYERCAICIVGHQNTARPRDTRPQGARTLEIHGF